MHSTHTPDYVGMDMTALQRVYSQEMDRFKASLLNGTPWEEVQECRLNVTALSFELHKRLSNSGKHPAASNERAR